MSIAKNVDKATISIFWQASMRHKKLFALSWLYPIGAVCISAVAPLFVGKTLAALVTPGADPMQYVPHFAVTAVIGIICNRVGFVAMLRWQAETMSYLQERALEVLLKRSVGFHNNTIGGKLVSDAIDYPSGYSQISNAVYVNIIPISTILIVGTSIIFFESLWLGLVISAMTVITVGWGILESRRRSHLRTKRLKATKAVTGHLADSILNVQTIKTFGREQEELQQHKELNHTLRDYRLNDWALAAVQGNNRIAVLLVLQLGFVLCAINLIRDNPALLGIGIFAFSFTITLSNKLFEVNAIVRTLEDGLLAASPMTEVLLQDVEITDNKNAKPLRATKGKIEFRQVTFRYDDDSTQHQVFDGLDLTIAPGEKIGLVGPSGGGKSTLTRLVLRFEDIQRGKILFDGQDITSVTQASLRKAISYVPQEPLLFHRTVRENIAYGKPDASDEQIIRAAKLAHAHDFIAGLTDGYDTIVGERGVKLSGGQRQRIAIARAILKDAGCIILDEATSALDSESEVLIQEALWELMKNRTAIVIAHRLSTIQKMDRILVLDGGRIIEQGSHKELLMQKGLYAKLWKHQSGGFLED